MTRTRVTITIRPELLELADRRASARDRSRSWVFEQAVKAYLGTDESGGIVSREPTTTYAPGLGATRQAQLEADLALTPDERVRIAEETARIGAPSGPRGQRDRVIMFSRWEDFLDWERREGIPS